MFAVWFPRCATIVPAFAAFALAPAGAQTPTLKAIVGAVSVVKESVTLLNDTTDELKRLACNVQSIVDAPAAKRRRTELDSISSELTSFEIMKGRFVRHLARFQAAPSDAGWRGIQGELMGLLDQTRQSFDRLFADADFKAKAPQAARNLIRALDGKGEVLDALRRMNKPNTQAELKALSGLADEMNKELNAIESAHDAFGAYVAARTAGRKTCAPD